MSAVTDDAVLAAMKQHLKQPYQDAIASATTLQEAEILLLPHFAGPGAVREKVRLIRAHLELEGSALPDHQAGIVS